MAKKLCIGLLAHVDSGKTTLSEALLYEGGSIRRLGRVDKKDAFLDNDPIERERGITIFSKQARLLLDDAEITLLDTPGHTDFSAETERTLWVLDYAVLLISAADGVQGHTETLWRLLARHRIPTFLFINKMDQPGADRERILSELQKKLSESCLDFSSYAVQTAQAEAPPGGNVPAAEKKTKQHALEKVVRFDFDGDFYEAAAVCGETALERFLSEGKLSKEEIAALIAERKLFPCFFGSALRLEGTAALLSGLLQFTERKTYPDAFGARVYKIGRDAQGKRLSFLKVTGGSLRARMPVGEEKADQIRIYSGASYENVSEAEAGTVCAVTGLAKTQAGMGLGTEADAAGPMLEPVLSYRIALPEGTDVHAAWLKLRELEEEDPELSLVWQESLSEIHARLMGEVQTEVLKRRIRERFQLDVEFTEGRIVYKETIRRPVIGIGHYEPLRHYAEVQLLLRPLPRGSGLRFSASVREEQLLPVWQRLVLKHLAERAHPGVLLGAPITDMEIELVAGRAHEKHTEGGDFRQATYRAVRQGLMQAESILLEPYYRFQIELPQAYAGRVLSDLSRMGAHAEEPRHENGLSVIRGSAPVAKMRAYPQELAALSRGRGRILLSAGGYEACRDQEEIVSKAGYDPERDAETPSGSIFCAHGAGFYVGWREVPGYAHTESGLRILEDGSVVREHDGTDGENEAGTDDESAASGKRAQHAAAENASAKESRACGGSYEEDRELEAIFQRAFGTGNQRERAARAEKGAAKRPARSILEPVKKTAEAVPSPKESWLLVDGYNIIYAWAELRELAALNFDAARERLLEILSNYQGYKRCGLIVVFDAYKVEGRFRSEVEKRHNLYVVYTKQAETADQYIAKAVQELGGSYRVTVASSDQLVQLIILGHGALRISANELYAEVQAVNDTLRRDYLERSSMGKNEALRAPIKEASEQKTRSARGENGMKKAEEGDRGHA